LGLYIAQKFTAFLFTSRELSFGNEIIPNMSKVKYQSTSTVVKVVDATKELGLFTRDEYREMLGYEPLGPERGGDEIMIAVNNYDSANLDQNDNQEGEENNE
jgi:hypothetical protein